MTLLADGNGHDTGLISGKGRPVIFTPERMDQIRNLVERGTSREEIAEIIGCTIGSLAVTCSKAGISLRRPRDAAPVKRTPRTPKPVNLTRDPKDVLEPPGGWPPGHPFHGGGGDDDKPKDKPTFVLRIGHGKRTYDLPLNIDSHTLCELACMANLNNVSLTEMLARAIVAGIKEITS